MEESYEAVQFHPIAEPSHDHVYICRLPFEVSGVSVKFPTEEPAEHNHGVLEVRGEL